MSSIPASAQSAEFGRWPRALLFLTLGLAVLGTAFASTLAGMVDTWWRSETFAHGLVIYPISLWLVWRERERLREVSPALDGRALVPIGALLLGWCLGRLAQVQVVEEGALVAMVAAAVWLFLGPAVVRVIWFALAFTAFAVPFGEGLIPVLMEFTATFTVGAVQLTGIPIYRDGMLFSLPSGDFEVAKACSGIRYLIASTALGTLYAYLTYRTPWRRGAFIACAIAVPIVANGLRAFGIVMIAHYSQMRYAVGVDHLIYGWLFFGVVIFLLFSVGARFREDEEPVPASAPAHGKPYVLARASLALGAMVLMTTSAALLAVRATVPSSGPTAQPALALGQGDWVGPLPAQLTWSPMQPDADEVLRAAYSRADGSARVEVAVAVFDPRGRAGEVTSAINAVTDRHLWTPVSTPRRLAAPPGEGGATAPSHVNSSELRFRSEWVFWQWFVVGERALASDVSTKIEQVGGALRGEHLPAASIMVAMPRGEIGKPIPPALREFLATHGAQLARCATATVSDSACGGIQP